MYSENNSAEYSKRTLMHKKNGAFDAINTTQSTSKISQLDYL